MKNRLLYLILLIIFKNTFSQNLQWENISPNADIKVYSIFIDYSDNIYLGCSNGNVFFSSNNGKSWENIRNNLDSNTTVNSIIKTESNKIFLSASSNRFVREYIYSSENNGLTWDVINDNQPLSTDYNAIKFFIDNSGMIWITGDFMYKNWGNTFKSSDNGLTWSELVDSSNNSFGINAIDINSADIIYIAQKSSGSFVGSLIRSTNNGQNWTYSIINKTANTINSDAMHYTFIGRNTEGIFKSLDGVPGTWEKTSTGLNSFIINSIIRVKDQKLYTATNDGIYMSSNYGDQWISFDIGIINKVVTSLVKNSKNDLYAIDGNHNVYRFENSVSSINSSDEYIPNTFCLSQNYPNPFNPSTIINFRLSKSGFVNIDIYNSIGIKVEKLVSENFNSGEHSIEWRPKLLSSGVYFYKMEINGSTQIKKMILLK